MFMYTFTDQEERNYMPCCPYNKYNGDVWFLPLLNTTSHVVSLIPTELVSYLILGGSQIEICDFAVGSGQSRRNKLNLDNNACLRGIIKYK